jgi:hypothetical protein
MTVQDEVSWLLDVIRDEWPESYWPQNVALRNRDEPRTRYPDDEAFGGTAYDSAQYDSTQVVTTDFRTVREEAADVDRDIVISVSSGSTQRTFYGNKPQYRVERNLDVRIESKPDEEWGESVDVEAFNRTARYTQRAINTELTYPDVPSGDDVGRIEYLDLGIVDENRLSVENKDYYLTTFTVRMRGNQDTP